MLMWAVFTESTVSSILKNLQLVTDAIADYATHRLS